MSLFEGMGAFRGLRMVAADNPWGHDNYGSKDHGAAKAHYDEMTVEELCGMPVRELLHPGGALLALWCTSPQAADGAHREVADAWGFTLTTRLFVWLKCNRACESCGHPFEAHAAAPVTGAGPPAGACGDCARSGKRAAEGRICRAFAPSMDFGPGNYTGANAEDVWLGVRGGRGKAPARWSKDRARRDVRSVIIAPTDEHSRKPEQMQDRLEALWPHVAPQDRVEMFARRRRAGWLCWGAQCPSPDPIFGEALGGVWPVVRPKPDGAAALFGPCRWPGGKGHRLEEGAPCALCPTLHPEVSA